MNRLLFALLLASTAQAQGSIGLPSREPLFVLQGGDTPNVNYHMATPSQAFAVDFGVVGGPTGRELARRPATRVEEFYCWNTVVMAPVDGRIVAVENGLPDNPIGERDTIHVLGNHVILRNADRFYFIAHLRAGSVGSRLGATVRRGQALGRCGNSGNSDFPHIHLHATHAPHLGEGTGINLIFGPIHADLVGKQFDNVEWPMLRGLWVHAP
jgi:hypothetical protein